MASQGTSHPLFFSPRKVCVTTFGTALMVCPQELESLNYITAWVNLGQTSRSKLDFERIQLKGHPIILFRPNEMTERVYSRPPRATDCGFVHFVRVLDLCIYNFTAFISTYLPYDTRLN